MKIGTRENTDYKCFSVFARCFQVLFSLWMLEVFLWQGVSTIKETKLIMLWLRVFNPLPDDKF